MPHALLYAAFALVLVFEFINGFHDSANAVATVIYTRTLRPMVAIVWSAGWNFIGAVVSNGAVAYGIMALLPIHLIESDPSLGATAIVSVLLSAILWNFGTWYLGLPLSSTHTLIGSMLGAQLAATALLPDSGFAHSIHWEKVRQVFWSLLLSPLAGFVFSFLLLRMARAIAQVRSFRQSPETGRAPVAMRGLLIFTSAGVSFAHGSNDAQKGMGLMMLVLIAMAPAAYGDGAAIPIWVKLMGAVVMGLGTMVGWKRVTTTLGEKIGTEHMTYAQGATAELVAFGTILGADRYGLPVSTTHVLTSGIAGTMLANRSGLQPKTLRNILLAWVLTLPVCVMLGAGIVTGGLFMLLHGLF
jgi:phosphate/sulfate permease